MLACCQGLKSLKFDLARTKIEPVLVSLYPLPSVHLTFSDSPQNVLQKTEYDTGPPVPGFFVQTALQLSLRENAPPIVA
jgi:hypothetical protein